MGDRIRGPARLVAVVLIAASAGADADAQDLEAQLDGKRSQLERTETRGEVLSSDLDRYSSRLDELAGQVAVLRNREAIVAAELERVAAKLGAAERRLARLDVQLRRSLNVLRERLVQIYRSHEPDVLTVILHSDGFDQIVDRYEFLRRIEEQDADIVGRVRDLRDATRLEVDRVRAARDQIAAKRAELERTRVELEGREADLELVRRRKASALERVQSSARRLEGDIRGLEDKIQAQLQAAQASVTTAPRLPVGPIQGGESASGLIWPVDGAISSPFGQRWGRLHAGIDIAAPGGTPIRAAKAGTIVLAEPYGGYGNYTCIAHGDGLSTCYAHQSAFELTSGPVDQGTVIGYVGNTGASLGDHLHFEVRVNGEPVDPLGYL